ncbi:ABC transporter permease [Streptomyces canus]|uniref:ABC transporter permease n=1 Tax=Streptomyces canus TaxID=58343 RepID=UPI00371B9E9C
MTTLPFQAGPAATGSPPRSRRDPVIVVTATVCVVLVLLALLAPLLTPYAPDATDVYAIDQGPTSAHLLGTDSLGRDVFSRLLDGARLSLLGPALVTVTATVLGTSLALLAVWHGGWVERILVRLLDILFAFPSLLFAILAVVAFGTGLTAPAIALAVAYTPYVARIVHSVAASERHLPYIESCQLLGYSTWRTVLTHVLRNLRLAIGAQATITYGYALLDLAAISFIGLGVQPPTAQWGLMVSDGTSDLLNGHGQQSLAAGAAIVLTVVTVNVLGERLAARSERSR